jgi:hypothetical protein
LPHDFAAKLLEAELELDNNCSLIALETLMSLYQEAVEFYERNDDLRYLDIQHRIHLAIMKPQVMAMLSRPPGDRAQTGAETGAETRLHDKSREKLKGNKAILTSSETAACRALSASQGLDNRHTTEYRDEVRNPMSRSAYYAEPDLIEAERTMTHTAVAVSNGVLRTVEDVRLQSTQLQLRRQARRARRSLLVVESTSTHKGDLGATGQRPGTLSAEKVQMGGTEEAAYKESVQMSRESQDKTVILSAEESDKSAGYSRSPVSADEFEAKLEELMERSYSQKTARLLEARAKYQAEISQAIGEVGDPSLAAMLTVQMQKHMERALSAIASECDVTRRQEVVSLKAQLGL